MKNLQFFSKRLKLLRESHNLSMSELAELLFMKSSAAINEFESGRSKPTLETALTIALYFGISLDWLFGLSNTPYTNESIAAANKACIEREQRVFSDNNLEELITITSVDLKIKPAVFDISQDPPLAYYGNYVFLKNITFLNDLEHLQQETSSPIGQLQKLVTNNRPKRLDKRKIERYKLFIKAHYGYFNEPIFTIPLEEKNS